MSTRGFLSFVVDGAEKTVYNHFDSYPEGFGVRVLTWLRYADLDATVEAARALRVVSFEEQQVKPTQEDVARYGRWLRRRNARPGQSLDEPDDWYDLLYLTHGDPVAMLEAGAIEDAHLFPLDSLFAEWGYVVDFDTQAFEAYEGFQHAPHESGRFATRERPADVSPGYWPVALKASWPLKDLPTDEEFVKTLESPDNEDE
jgi:hypothetical protein